MNYLAILDGSRKGIDALGEGALCAVIAILIVFAVLAVIILISNLVSFAISNKKETKEEATNNDNNVVANTTTVDYNDEDVMAAILVATIDYRNEIKKDVKVLNVREVK